MDDQPLLLDTNILVHGVRRGPVWDRIQAEYQLFLAEPTPLVCVVSVGELRSLALLREWEAARLDQMAFLLSSFREASASAPDVVDVYAEIAADAVRGGHAIGQNDLWIAATAIALRATLLTADRDFDWLAPSPLAVALIDPVDPD